MQRKSLMRRWRTAPWKTGLGAALVVWLLLAESLAVTHGLDRAAHGDGQPCVVCLSVADLGAGAVAADVAFVIKASAPLSVFAVVFVLLARVPSRRYARGPPSVSFAS
jgi:hypothetical protein